jgi:uncharacterized protein (UPF0261 family)
MCKTIAIIATCDTKGQEAAYLKQKLESYEGIQGLVVDTGILGKPLGVVPGVSREEVAQAAGMTIPAIIALGSRGLAVEKMSIGVNSVLTRLHKEGTIDGLLAIGGGEGSVIARSAMDALPLGVPKLTISSIASGDHKFKDIIGYNDAVVMHSVIDILGLNSISRQIFDVAVGGVVGMVRVPKQPETLQVPRIGITMLGTTTKPILNVIKPGLEERGYEVFTFHANGVGGACMEDLAREGYFTGILDFSTNELVANLFGGLHIARPERLKILMELGLPVVVAPGAISLIVLSKEDALDPKYDGRQKYYHNPRITLARTSRDEMAQLGRHMASILNLAVGPVRFLYPTEGFASQDKQSYSLYDPEGNRIFIEEMRKLLRNDIPIIEIKGHINDDHFAQAALMNLMEIVDTSR